MKGFEESNDKSLTYFLSEKMIFILFLVILYWVCYYCCPNFLPFCPPPPSTPHSFRQFLHLCSCPWVMHIHSLTTQFPILYFTFPWLLCYYLFVFLNPFTSPPIPSRPSPTWHARWKLWTIKWQYIHIYQQLNLKNKLSKQEEQRHKWIWKALWFYF